MQQIIRESEGKGNLPFKHEVTTDLFQPLLVVDGNTAQNDASQRKDSPFKQSKWWRALFAVVATLLTLSLVFFFVASFAKIDLSSSSSLGNDVATPSNDLVTLSATSSSWNAFLSCHRYEWKLENKDERIQGKSVAVHVFDSSSESTKSPPEVIVSSASATCKNLFGANVGTSPPVELFSSSFSNNSYQLISETNILKCPELIDRSKSEGTLEVAGSERDKVRLSSVLYSSLCDGFIVKVVNISSSMSAKSEYDERSGKLAISASNGTSYVIDYTVANVSLQDVFFSLKLPPTDIPYGELIIPKGRDHKHETNLLSSYNLLNEMNWKLAFSGGSNNFYSGYSLFNQISWTVESTIQELTYSNGKFQGLTWRASTTMLINGDFCVQISSAGYTTVTIPLFSVNSPPEVIPIPVLEFITLNTELDLSLVLSIDAEMISSIYSMLWKYETSLTFEWEITCSKELSSVCTANILKSDVTFLSSPSGTVSSDGSPDEDSQSTLNIGAALVLGLGLQFDEMVALKDELAIQFALEAPSGQLTCPQMDLRFMDSIALHLRFFTIDLLPIFAFPVYEGDTVIISSSTSCAPTLAPTKAPTDGSIANHLYYFVYWEPTDTGGWGFGTASCYCANGLVKGNCGDSCSKHNQYGEYYWTQYSTLQTTTLNGIGTFEYNLMDHYEDHANNPPLIYHNYVNIYSDLINGEAFEYFGPDAYTPVAYPQPSTKPYLACRSILNTYDESEFNECMFSYAKRTYDEEIVGSSITEFLKRTMIHNYYTKKEM